MIRNHHILILKTAVDLFLPAREAWVPLVQGRCAATPHQLLRIHKYASVQSLYGIHGGVTDFITNKPINKLLEE